MARINEADIARVREATDLVAVVQDVVPLKQKGRDLWCCCPFHQEKTPSMKVDPSTQLWHCFGCGEGGDVFGFVMKSEDLSFPEAVRLLAERAHIDIAEEEGRGPRTTQNQKLRLKEVCRATAEFYHDELLRNRSPEADAARKYLAGRELKTPVAKRWKLGFAPGRGALVRHLTSKGFSGDEMTLANVALPGRDGRLRDRFFNRIMFPIFDASGDCIAFGGRVVGKGEPKYLNSQETPLFHKSKVLYGLDKAKAAMAATGIAIVVEGYTDVIALAEAGITNVVATLGTALTAQHIRLLSRHASKQIIYLFDGDEAGQRASDRALGFIDSSMTPEAGRTKTELAAVTLPDNLDPAEFVAARGADALQQLLAQAKPLLEYGIDRKLARVDMRNTNARMQAMVEAINLLAPIKDSILAKHYAVEIAGRTQVREEDALELLAKLQPPRRYDGREEGGSAPAQPQPTAPRAVEIAGRTQVREEDALELLAKLQPPRRYDGREEGGSAPAQPQPTAPRIAQDGPTYNDYVPAGEEWAPATPTAGFGFQESVSRGEVNRLRFERDFLGVLAQNPADSAPYLDSVAALRWHAPFNEAVAFALVDQLYRYPAIDAAALVGAVEQAVPRSAAMLSAQTVPQGRTVQEHLAFVFEELQIGDLEDSLAEMRRAFQSTPFTDDERRDAFTAITSLNQTINQRKAAHARSISLD